VELLFINHRDPYHPQAGGAEEILYQVAKRLVGKGVSVTWLSENAGRAPTCLDGLRFVRRGNTFTLHLYAPMYVKRFDVVVDSVAHAVPFFSYLAVRKKSVALVHHVHQDVLGYELNPFYSSMLRFLERRIKDYSHVISVSCTTRKQLVERLNVDPRKITVIHSGVDHSVYKPGGKFGEPVVLWLARLKNYKNPLDSLRILRRMKVKAKLLIAGGGDLEAQIREAVKGFDNVSYLGRVGPEKVGLYQGAWAFLSTSFIEGWGMTVVEANACGTPAVAYSTGSLPEVIREGENGFLVDYKDYDRAAKLLDYLLEDEDTMRYYSKKSYDHSLQYDWDKTAEKYHGFLRSIAGV
jgi:glycosyltransferase involved in cell wall biosynthesis